MGKWSQTTLLFCHDVKNFMTVGTVLGARKADIVNHGYEQGQMALPWGQGGIQEFHLSEIYTKFMKEKMI